MADAQETKVLIVEDDTFLRDIYKHTFQKAGFLVDSAVDGVDGVEMAEKTSYDVVLLDIMMPRKNGIEVLQDLRKGDSPAKETPILLLTNLGQEKIIREAYRLGANGFILKADLLPRQVLEKVKAFLAGELSQEDFLPSKSSD